MLHASDLQADTARKAASRPFELGHVAPVAVALRALRPGPSLRTRTVDEGHLTTLLELAGHWPPLLVHQASMTVVDGLHRFEAARRLGLELVAVLLIDRPFEEVRLIALHENVTHGLPLSILERRRAALELLAAHPTWSDGRLAELCGLSRRSIGKLRRTTTDPAKPIESTWREGRDGRQRPPTAGVLLIPGPASAEAGFALRGSPSSACARVETLLLRHRVCLDRTRARVRRVVRRAGRRPNGAGEPCPGSATQSDLRGHRRGRAPLLGMEALCRAPPSTREPFVTSVASAPDCPLPRATALPVPG